MTMPNRAPAELESHANILIWAIRQLCGNLDKATISYLLERITLQRLKEGETLYRQGESGAQMHVVLSGRLQVHVRSPDGMENIVAHPQPGDVIGEMAVFSGSGRAATISAVRDSLLGAIDRADIEQLAVRFPQVFSNITRMIVQRLTGSSGRIARRSGTRSVMILPMHHSADSTGFCARLRTALLQFGSVLHLDAHAARKRFDNERWESYGHHLEACEDEYDFLILEGVSGNHPWNKVCHVHADRTLLLADAIHSPELTEAENQLHTVGAASRTIDLVLVQTKQLLPKDTRLWLTHRQVNRHHHIRRDCVADIARIARVLSGHSVSLVLAGGGARGFAHLGVIRALGEAGIEIDAVGGASFGALAATGLARGLSDAAGLEEQRNAFALEDPLGDYTLPIMSLVRGEHLDRVLHDHLPMDIEDLWLPFFAVSSNLTTSEVNVHDHGPLWKAIRASVSLPAILPPSLQDGQLLIDGGVLNNLPVDVMRERMRGQIIAVDLAVGNSSPEKLASIPGLADYLKGHLMPGQSAVEAPTISRIIVQLTTMASRREMRNTRKLADLYLNPPLGSYDFLDWGSMREIADIGYRHTLPLIRDWLRQHPRLQTPASYIRATQQRMAA